MCGYAHVPTYSSWTALSPLKSNPAFEKYGVNAALVHHVLVENEDRLTRGGGITYVIVNATSIIKPIFRNILKNIFPFGKQIVKYS